MVDSIIFDGNNALKGMDSIVSGNKVVIVTLKNGEKVAIPSDPPLKGEHAIILTLQNGEKIAVKTSKCVKIRSAFSESVIGKGETFNLGNFTFYWDGTSRIYVGAQCQDITSVNLKVDDELIVTNGSNSISRQFGDGNKINPTAAWDITSIFTEGINTINFTIEDVYGVYLGTTDLYMFKV